MKYRVFLEQPLLRYGHIEIDAESGEAAERLAVELAKQRGVVVKTPEWTELERGHVRSLGFQEA